LVVEGKGKGNCEKFCTEGWGGGWIKSSFMDLITAIKNYYLW
jgi:hypothetical protein